MARRYGCYTAYTEYTGNVRCLASLHAQRQDVVVLLFFLNLFLGFNLGLGLSRPWQQEKYMWEWFSVGLWACVVARLFCSSNFQFGINSMDISYLPVCSLWCDDCDCNYRDCCDDSDNKWRCFKIQAYLERGADQQIRCLLVMQSYMDVPFGCVAHTKATCWSSRGQLKIRWMMSSHVAKL